MKISMDKRKIGYTYGSVSGYYAFRKQKSIAFESTLERDLLKALYIDTFHKFTKSNNTTFNRYSITDREYLLSCVCKIFQFDVESLITLFINHDVSKKTLRRTYKHLSPTISYIISKLPDSVIHKPPRVVKKEITPKSKKEVDALFEEIKKFL